MHTWLPQFRLHCMCILCQRRQLKGSQRIRVVCLLSCWKTTVAHGSLVTTALRIVPYNLPYTKQTQTANLGWTTCTYMYIIDVRVYMYTAVKHLYLPCLGLPAWSVALWPCLSLSTSTHITFIASCEFESVLPLLVVRVKGCNCYKIYTEGEPREHKINWLQIITQIIVCNKRYVTCRYTAV